MAVITRAGASTYTTSTDGGQGINEGVNFRLVSSGTVVNLNKADNFVVVNKVISSSTTVNLPTNPFQGELHVVKDGKGDSAFNNITVLSAPFLIDGQSSYLVNSPYGSVNILFNGLSWNII